MNFRVDNRRKSYTNESQQSDKMDREQNSTAIQNQQANHNDSLPHALATKERDDKVPNSLNSIQVIVLTVILMSSQSF